MKEELSSIKHERSAKQYPEIDLQKGEYVVLELKRAKIGVALIWAMVVLCTVLLSIVVISIANSKEATNTIFPINNTAMSCLWLMIVSFYLVIFAGGFIGQTIYNSNCMYVPNKRAIQKIRLSLFSNETQVIELAKIEDVSFRQSNIIDHILQVGTLRMSTVGDETTYTFTMLETPRDEVATISELVYATHHPDKPHHRPSKKESVKETSEDSAPELAPNPNKKPIKEAAPTMPAPVETEE